MRFFVKSANGGSSHVVPCQDVSVTVRALKENVVKRLRDTNGCSDSSADDDVQYRLLLAGTESALEDRDIVQDVLRDGDCLILQSESPNKPTS